MQAFYMAKRYASTYFDQFYVNAPICSPSRVAITTGTYPQRWKITSYLSDSAKNIRCKNNHWLPTAAPTLARLLGQQGYATGHIQKLKELNDMTEMLKLRAAEADK